MRNIIPLTLLGAVMVVSTLESVLAGGVHMQERKNIKTIKEQDIVHIAKNLISSSNAPLDYLKKNYSEIFLIRNSGKIPLYANSSDVEFVDQRDNITIVLDGVTQMSSEVFSEILGQPRIVNEQTKTTLYAFYDLRMKERVCRISLDISKLTPEEGRGNVKHITIDCYYGH